MGLGKCNASTAGLHADALVVARMGDATPYDGVLKTKKETPGRSGRYGFIKFCFATVSSDFFIIFFTYSSISSIISSFSFERA